MERHILENYMNILKNRQYNRFINHSHRHNIRFASCETATGRRLTETEVVEHDHEILATRFSKNNKLSKKKASNFDKSL